VSESQQSDQNDFLILKELNLVIRNNFEEDEKLEDETND